MFFLLDLRLSGDVIWGLIFQWALYSVRVYGSRFIFNVSQMRIKNAALWDLNGAATIENSMVVPQKIKHRITI